LRRLPCFRPFTPDELAFVESFKVGDLHVGAGIDIVTFGAAAPRVYTVYGGWAFRYNMLEDGRRQILSFLLPGDLIGLQSAVLDVMQHSVEALTDVHLCAFERGGLWKLFERMASLSFDVTWLAATEESMVDNHLLSVGRQWATERVSFLILHLAARMDALGEAEHGQYRLPLRQQHIADATGLSLVHTNRTLRKLVKRGLIAVDRGAVKLLDKRGLESLSGIDARAIRNRPFI
jgi:CRP-like cAMP-binding protein